METSQLDLEGFRGPRVGCSLGLSGRGGCVPLTGGDVVNSAANTRPVRFDDPGLARVAAEVHEDIVHQAFESLCLNQQAGVGSGRVQHSGPDVGQSC